MAFLSGRFWWNRINYELRIGELRRWKLEAGNWKLEGEFQKITHESTQIALLQYSRNTIYRTKMLNNFNRRSNGTPFDQRESVWKGPGAEDGNEI